MEQTQILTIEKNCNEYNLRAKKQNLHSRLQYVPGTGLQLGNEEQFAFGTHQCLLTDDISAALVISSSMLRQICFDYGAA